MIKMRFHLLRFAFIATTSFVFAYHGQAGDSCASGFTPCTPSGATSETTPQIGTPAFQGLFMDIVLSSLPTSSRRSSSPPSASLCCKASLSCLLMVNLEIPFCYDRFTTNYFLPDGSYGTVVCYFFQHRLRSNSLHLSHFPFPYMSVMSKINGAYGISLGQQY